MSPIKPASGPLAFQWPVVLEGYAWVSAPKGGGEPTWLRPLSNRVEWKRPLSNEALHREFAATPATRDGILGFVSKWGLLQHQRSGDSLQFWQLALEDMRTVLAMIDSGALGEACERINRNRYELTPGLSYDDASNAASFVLRPPNLFSALWFQLMRSIAAGTLFRQCKECASWFTYGPGTGRRVSAQFCTDRCRKAYHAKHLQEHGGSK